MTDRTRGERCAACLGSRQCWICLGTGLIEERSGGLTPCASCEATGTCSLCSKKEPDGGREDRKSS